MKDFDKGYKFYNKQIEDQTNILAGRIGDKYIDDVNIKINSIADYLNEKLKDNNTDFKILKGNLAEFWHEKTFNVSADINDVERMAKALESTDFASVDIAVADKELIEAYKSDDVITKILESKEKIDGVQKYSSKYYATGEKSAIEQGKSYYEIFKKYQADGGKDDIETFFENKGIDTNKINYNDSIYQEQTPLIPKGQESGVDRLANRKLGSVKDGRNMDRYEWLKNNKTTKIHDEESGIESKDLTRTKAEKLTRIRKRRKITPEDVGLDAKDFITYKNIFNKAFKAGMTAATITIALKVAPEMYKALDYLIKTGEIDIKQFKEIGFSAVSGGSEAFVRGTVSAGLVASCEAGLLGEVAKNIDPAFIGAMTVIICNTIKNSYSVAKGEMKNSEAVEELIKELFVSAGSLGFGYVSQILIHIPFAFMVGSVVGSMAGAFIYQSVHKTVLSFCIDSGYTMFGLVEQDYRLPKSVLKEIGMNVFEYEKMDIETMDYEKVVYDTFEYNKFEYDKFDIKFIRRGVIGINKIGYTI